MSRLAITTRESLRVKTQSHAVFWRTRRFVCSEKYLQAHTAHANVAVAAPILTVILEGLPGYALYPSTQVKPGLWGTAAAGLSWALIVTLQSGPLGHACQ